MQACWHQSSPGGKLAVGASGIQRPDRDMIHLGCRAGTPATRTATSATTCSTPRGPTATAPASRCRASSATAPPHAASCCPCCAPRGERRGCVLGRLHGPWNEPALLAMRHAAIYSDACHCPRFASRWSSRKSMHVMHVWQSAALPVPYASNVA